MTEEKAITNRQLNYLLVLEDRLKLPVIKDVIFSELTREQAKKLIEVLKFAWRIRKRKSVVLDNSGEFLKKAVRFYLKRQKNSKINK